MSRSSRQRVRLIATSLLAALATAAVSVGTALAGSSGPPFPK